MIPLGCYAPGAPPAHHLKTCCSSRPTRFEFNLWYLICPPAVIFRCLFYILIAWSIYQILFQCRIESGCTTCARGRGCRSAIDNMGNHVWRRQRGDLDSRRGILWELWLRLRCSFEWINQKWLSRVLAAKWIPRIVSPNDWARFRANPLHNLESCSKFWNQHFQSHRSK